MSDKTILAHMHESDTDCDFLVMGSPAPKGVATLAFALTCLISVLATAPHAAAEDVSTGKKLAGKYCAGCHAIGAEGKSKVATATPFRNFWKKWSNKDFDPGIARSMVMGAHPRTPKSVTEPDGFSDIIAYIQSVQVMRMSD